MGLVAFVLAVGATTALLALDVPTAAASVVCEPETHADLVEAAAEAQSDEEAPSGPAIVPNDDEPAEPEPEIEPCDTPFVYTMTFPIVGAGGIGSPFGAGRDGGSRLHAGVDLFAPTLQPVVAVADGTVARLAVDRGISGTMVVINHDDGWSSFYIHLNNDIAGSDDGRGVGIRSTIAEGDRVSAGDLIGWVGDSGNAESTEPHLHFELHQPGGGAVNPEASLVAAKANRQVTIGDQLREFTGPFYDLEDGSTSPLARLLTEGFDVTCHNGFGACADEFADASDVESWLTAHFGPVTVVSPDAQPIPAAGTSDCSSSAGPCLESTTDSSGILAVTEAELSRALAWLKLQATYQQRLNQVATAQTDGDLSSIRVPPEPFDLTLEKVHVLLNDGAVCSPYPDDTTVMNRTDVAAWIIDRLIDPSDRCDPRLARLLPVKTR